MKKKTRHLLSGVLAVLVLCTLLFSLAIPAFAQELEGGEATSLAAEPQAGPEAEPVAVEPEPVPGPEPEPGPETGPEPDAQGPANAGAALPGVYADMPAGEPLELPVTVYFMLDAATPHSTEELMPGSLVAEPAPPDTLPEGMNSFLGWYTQEGQPYDFGQPVTGDLVLLATFSTYHLVRFMVDGLVVESALVAPGSTLPAASYEPAAPSGQRFMYWYDREDEQRAEFVFGVTPVNSNLVLIPCFGDAYYVFFVSGGTAVDPQIVPAGTSAGEPQAPSRDGYAFKHWTDDTNSEAPFDFATGIQRDTTLYGVWEPLEVPYKIVYWLEKPNLPEDFDKDDPGNYSYAWADTGTAAAGTELNFAKSDLKNDVEELKYASFYKSESTVVRGDGTTLVNVYYTRVIFTINFDFVVPGSGATTTLKVGGQTYTYTNDETGMYSIRVKYEQDVGNIWPCDDIDENGEHMLSLTRLRQNGSIARSLFTGWTVPEIDGLSHHLTWISRRMTVTDDMLPNDWEACDEYTLTKNWFGHANFYYVNYMVEALEEDAEGAVRYKGTDYLRDDGLSMYFYYTAPVFLSPKEIMGLEPAGAAWVGINGNKDDGGTIGGAYKEPDTGAAHEYLFYKRLEYTLSLDALGGTPANGGVYTDRVYKYGAPLAEPEKPVREGYAFKGWYADAGFYTKIDFSTATMPARNLELYAKWEPLVNTATFYDGVYGSVLGTVPFEDGGTVAPAPEYSYAAGEQGAQGAFVGWYWYVSGRLVPFPLDTRLWKDTSIYAVWKNGGYTLTYDANGGTGAEVPTDDAEYARRVLAPVQDGSGLTRDGQRFIGWQVGGTGQTYYNGNALAMVKDTVLVARYTEPGKHYVTVYYHANDGSGEAVAWIAEVGGSFDVAGSGLFTRTGHRLLGWADSEDGVVRYDFNTPYPHAIILDTDIHLYAVWEQTDFAVTVEYYLEQADGSYLWNDSEETPLLPLGATVTPVSPNWGGVLPVYPGYTVNEAHPDAVWSAVVDGPGVVLKVYYDLERVTVRFDAAAGGWLDGGTEQVVATGTGFGSVAVPTPVPRTGYAFAGWSPALPESSYAVTKDLAFTATFAAVDTGASSSSALPSSSAPPSSSVPPSPSVPQSSSGSSSTVSPPVSSTTPPPAPSSSSSSAVVSSSTVPVESSLSSSSSSGIPSSEPGPGSSSVVTSVPDSPDPGPQPPEPPTEPPASSAPFRWFAGEELGDDPTFEELAEATGTVRAFGEEIPRGSFAVNAWSLLSLMLSVLCVLTGAVMAGATAMRKNLRAAQQAAGAEAQGDEEAQAQAEARSRKAKRMVGFMAAVMGAMPLLFFLMLENITGQVALLSKHTPLVMLLALLHLVMCLVALLRQRDRAEPEAEPEEDGSGN